MNGSKLLPPLKSIKDLVIHIRFLPVRRRIMILSICLIAANMYSAVAGIWLLFVFSTYEFIKSVREGKNPKKIFFYLRNSLILIPGTIIVLGGTFGAIWHGNYMHSIISLFLLAPIVFTASMIKFIWKREDALHFARYCVMVMLPISLFAFLFPYPGNFITQASGPFRLMGTYSNPNYFSYILEVFILLGFALLYHVWDKKVKNSIILTSVIGMLVLYLTGSRTGIIAFLFGTAVFLVAMSEKGLLTVAFTVIAVTLAAAAIFPERAVEIIGGLIPRSYFVTRGIENRFEIWNIALRQIYKQPFIGTGLFTYSKYVPVNAPDAVRGAFHAHNIFINFWMETGLFGILSFVWIMVAAIVKLAKSLNKSPIRPYLAAVIAVIALTAVHGIMDAPLLSSQTISFYGFLLGTGCIGMENKEKDKSASGRHDAI